MYEPDGTNAIRAEQAASAGTLSARAAVAPTTKQNRRSLPNKHYPPTFTTTTIAKTTKSTRMTMTTANVEYEYTEITEDGREPCHNWPLGECYMGEKSAGASTTRT